MSFGDVVNGDSPNSPQSFPLDNPSATMFNFPGTCVMVVKLDWIRILINAKATEAAFARGETPPP